MNVFAVQDGEVYDLTRENYIKQTHKKFPFYQDPKEYKNPYFAICPACNNPIQIINLYCTQYQEEHTKRTDMHGRHHKNNVKGLPNYVDKNYQSCPLHNPVAFHLREVRNNPSIDNEILEIIEKNRGKICSDIREITGILLSNNKLNGIIDDYIKAGEYRYTHTNKFNIPYSILYTRKSINLFGQKINEFDIGAKIATAIQNYCKYIEYVNGQILNKISEYVELNLVVANHRIIGSRQYITIQLEEHKGGEIHCIFKKEIEMKQYIYK